MTTALHEVGYVLTETKPDYVIIGDTRTYSFTAITKAIRLINAGAQFIAINPGATRPSQEGPLPATGAVAAMVATATGRSAYFVGEPNPMMFRAALDRIRAHSETTAMVGDGMHTDVVAGMRTYLVLTGSTAAHEVERYPFRPSEVRDSIADLIDLID